MPLVRSSIFKWAKKLVPRISETELIALRSGTTSIDREIFNGEVKLPPYEPANFNNMNMKEQKYIEETLPPLLNKWSHLDPVFPNPKFSSLMEDLGKAGIYKFIVDPKYGGDLFSRASISQILSKMTSVNPGMGIVAMVPNSLGPAELLEKYGNEIQKKRYLPKLANGELIPCFGLTGPHNGSDAAGRIDRGVLRLNKTTKKLEVHLTLNKRYITLAPVADVIGVAFKLDDPDNLLAEVSSTNTAKEGITLALLDKGHPNLLQETCHNPLNVGFPNGTLKGSIVFSLDRIIGGVDNAGHGWKMLMECLAEGRGVSLPATANASSSAAAVGIWQYAKHRKQFGIPLIKMQGVHNKLVDVLYHSWLIDNSVRFMNYLLDQGERPAVLSAIIKEQTTERGRQVLNDAMDVHAGSAICLGPNNFLEKFYRSAPVGITVEGSNTLTKNLIIFGQGLNKSHPHIFPMFESILNDDEAVFGTNLAKMVKHSVRCYFSALKHSILPHVHYECRLKKHTAVFANLANMVSLQGGKLKKEQSLSADMAAIMSNLFMGYSVMWVQQRTPESSAERTANEYFVSYTIQRLCDENDAIFLRLFQNGPFSKPLHYLMRPSYPTNSYDHNEDLVRRVLENPYMLEMMKENIHIPGTALEKLLKLDDLEETSTPYVELYEDIISVGEFPIPISNEN